MERTWKGFSLVVLGVLIGLGLSSLRPGPAHGEGAGSPTPAVSSPGSAPCAQAPVNGILEYQSYKTNLWKSQEKDVEDLNKFGKDGWRVVGMITQQGTTMGYLMVRNVPQ